MNARSHAPSSSRTAALLWIAAWWPSPLALELSPAGRPRGAAPRRGGRAPGSRRAKPAPAPAARARRREPPTSSCGIRGIRAFGRGASVDLEEVRARRCRDNLYWQLAAPTEDVRVQQRARGRARALERRVRQGALGHRDRGRRSRPTIAHRQRLSADYVEFVSYVLDHYGDTISRAGRGPARAGPAPAPRAPRRDPAEDPGGDRAQARSRTQARAAWLADEAAFERRRRSKRDWRSSSSGPATRSQQTVFWLRWRRVQPTEITDRSIRFRRTGSPQGRLGCAPSPSVVFFS